MNNVLLLLLIAGLVVGVALVTGTITSTQVVAPNETRTYNSEPSQSGTGTQYKETLPDSSTPDKKITHQEASEATEKEGATGISPLTGFNTLDFKADVINEGKKVTSRFRIVNPDTEREKIRIDSTRENGSRMTIILDKESDQGWVKDYSTSGVTHITGIAFIQM